MNGFETIIGYSQQVEKLKTVADILESPDKYRKFDTELPAGLLLYGVEGVGKTFMAETLAEECGRTLFRITESVSAPKSVKRIFRQARRKAPSLIFIDDLDCYARDFYELLNSEMENSDGEDVFFLATYDGDEEDKYLDFCKSIFDLKIEIPTAEFDDKCNILRAFFQGKAMDGSFDLMDFCYFAQDCSCKEVEEAYRIASLKAVRDGKDGIRADHLIAACLEVQETPPATEFSERAAYHEAGHAAISLLLSQTPACIVLHENGGYYYAKVEHAKTFEEKEVRYLVGLGGKACEDVFFSSSGIGSYGDLDKVKRSIEYDLADLARFGFEYFDATQCESQAYNDLLAQKVREELATRYERAKKLIDENRPLITAIVERLKEKNYLLHSEIVGIYEGYLKRIPIEHN